MKKKEFIEGRDYYLDNGFVIMTEHYHKERGVCCGNQCRHCVFWPSHIKGVTDLKENQNFDKKDLAD